MSNLNKLDKVQSDIFNKLKGLSVKIAKKMLFKLMDEINEKSKIG